MNGYSVAGEADITVRVIDKLDNAQAKELLESFCPNTVVVHNIYRFKDQETISTYMGRVESYLKGMAEKVENKPAGFNYVLIQGGDGWVAYQQPDGTVHVFLLDMSDQNRNFNAKTINFIRTAVQELIKTKKPETYQKVLQDYAQSVVRTAFVVPNKAVIESNVGEKSITTKVVKGSEDITSTLVTKTPMGIDFVGSKSIGMHILTKDKQELVSVSPKVSQLRWFELLQVGAPGIQPNAGGGVTDDYEKLIRILNVLKCSDNEFYEEILNKYKKEGEVLLGSIKEELGKESKTIKVFLEEFVQGKTFVFNPLKAYLGPEVKISRNFTLSYETDYKLENLPEGVKCESIASNKYKITITLKGCSSINMDRTYAFMHPNSGLGCST